MRRLPERGSRLTRIVGALACVVIAVPFLGAPGAGAAPSSGPSRGEATIVVQTNRSLIHASSVLGAPATTLPGQRYTIKVAADRTQSEIASLEHQAGVKYASVVKQVYAEASPDDPCYVGLPSCTYTSETGHASDESADLGLIGAPAAWNISKGTGVRVALLDTAVDSDNPDLAGKISSFHMDCTDEADCVSTAPTSPPADCPGTSDYGHGTHVAGILAANTDNAIGVASLGWNVHVDVYEVLNACGIGNTDDVADAIYQAVANGDRVINMSLANESCEADPDPQECGPDPDTEGAVEYAIEHNVVVVAAAGNDGFDSPAYPASYPGVLSVAATDQNGNVQTFSQWGSAANIAAPGLDIVSTWSDGNCPADSMDCYFVDTGTSMSSPLVAAAAALLISNDPNLTAPQITELLEDTAGPTAGGDPIDGGVLNVPAALEAEANPPALYDGYLLTGSDGSVYPFGNAPLSGSLTGDRLAKPVVGISEGANGLGYWLVASDGGVFTFGDADFYGSTGGVRLREPIVGMASTPDGKGYWLVASDGGVFTFGDAGFYGSTGGVALHRPIVGMASTPDGKGYWLVASDGGIFTFGDAGFYGSTGGVALHRPIVTMASIPDGKGYWLVASDGGVFTFGDAAFYGSTGGVALRQPIVAARPTPGGAGYWLMAADGGVFTFGDARFWGSTVGVDIPAPIVDASS